MTSRASGSGDESEQTLGRWSEVLSLVRFDYEQTSSLVGRIVSTSEALRAGSITAAVAILGLALANDERMIALTAVVVLFAGLISDAYHDALYRVCQVRAVELEKLIDSFYQASLQEGPVGRRAERNLRLRLDRYRFGMTRSLRRPKLGDLYQSVVGRYFWALYLAFIVVSLLVFFLISPRDLSTPAPAGP